MRKSLVVTAALLLLSSGAMAQSYVGYFESASCSQLSGWAYDGYANDTSFVDIYDGAKLVQSNVAADIFRSDVQYWVSHDNGYHGFSLTPPAALIDGRQHAVYVKFSGTQIMLSFEPKVIQCTSTTQGYSYYY